MAKAASSYGTMFGVSSLATITVEEIAQISTSPKMFQFYFHKDRGLNDALLERAKAANFNVLALTVDTITGGNRERSSDWVHFASKAYIRVPIKFCLTPNVGLEFLHEREI